MPQLPHIAIAADHAGFEYKEALRLWLNALGYTVSDFGTFSADSSDYPDAAHPLAEAIENAICEVGILICGSANGVAITANKHQQVRAALCWIAEVAALARQHNNANVVCIPARYTALEQAKNIVHTFLHTDFEGGRHQRRVDKIAVC